jgi:hypothetical protein
VSTQTNYSEQNSYVGVFFSEHFCNSGYNCILPNVWDIFLSQIVPRPISKFRLLLSAMLFRSHFFYNQKYFLFTLPMFCFTVKYPRKSSFCNHMHVTLLHVCTYFVLFLFWQKFASYAAVTVILTKLLVNIDCCQSCDWFSSAIRSLLQVSNGVKW